MHAHVKKGLSQQYVELGIPAIEVTHPDRYVLSLMSNLLGAEE